MNFTNSAVFKMHVYSKSTTKMLYPELKSHFQQQIMKFNRHHFPQRRPVPAGQRLLRKPSVLSIGVQKWGGGDGPSPPRPFGAFC